MAQPQILRTAAERALIEQFGRFAEALSGEGADGDWRRAAFRRFEATGLPHRRIEEWKYTDLRAALRSAPPPAVAPVASGAAEAALARAPSPFDAVEASRLVFVDGGLVAELSGRDFGPGLSVRPLAPMFQAGEAPGFGRLAPPIPDPTFELNTAFLRDGAVISVRPGAAVEQVLHLRHVATGPEPATATLRHLVEVGEGASLTMLETWTGPMGAVSHANAVVELRLGARAKVTWIKVQAEAPQAVHLASLIAELGADSSLDHVLIASGAGLARNQLFVSMGGERASLATSGATLARGKQHLDATLVVDHCEHGGASRELYKAVLDDSARSVFQGKIVVRRGAQKTDAKMASHSVLLSDDAEANAKPELEIFADDVQCGHGATCGRLDERLRFYLQSRGIPRPEAEKLLVVAFLGEVLDAIFHEGLHEAALATVEKWLAGRVLG